MNLSDYLETQILNWLRGTNMPAAPATVYVALSSADPTEDGSGLAEPTFTGYARQAATFGAVGAGSGTESEIENTNDIEFGDPDDDGSITHFALFDAATDGNFLVRGETGTVNYQSTVNDPISFPAGSLVVSLD